ncbi:hypothetical protein [Paenibacillus illinoisensis]|uniref:hypothetical protein n=1 Tax=Paenibacillus illinoisensis TaxID=59845 RepID=UPI001C8EAC1B|nr:hypothetical protein [Paenibacillus illinoisensis]MBY0219825.1 hypothetical protein [Paenibacillus illinoisensis]
MKTRYALWLNLPMVILVLMLSACTGEAEPTVNLDPMTPESESVSPLPSEQEPASETTRPESESFELMTADGNQSMDADLKQGEGFSLYVFEKFTFNEAAGRLSLSSNPDYYVDIEPLPSDYDVTQLEAQGNEELSTFGEVSDYSGELVEHPLRFGELYLQASGEEGISDYMVWKSDAGDAFLFRLHNPKGEEASDFAGPVLVSLSTVQSDM